MFLFTIFLMDGPKPTNKDANSAKVENGHDNSAFSAEEPRGIRLTETSRL